MVPSTHTNASKWPTPSLILMFVHFKELVCVCGGGGSYGHFDKKIMFRTKLQNWVKLVYKIKEQYLKIQTQYSLTLLNS